ncbi:MAG TPA: cupredoxin domain-containing protein [Anaeromyxobacteraceae bacterium]|nr:cupredoxin domain-containing protein [Anaeromyxobacteraceae bacterium]
MTIQRTLAALAAATALAALPLAAAAQHEGGGHGKHACGHGGHAGHADQDQAAHESHDPAVAGQVLAQAVPSASAKSGARAATVVAIEVTGQGFVPARATVKVGRPVTLVVTRKTERTCATEIVIKDHGVNQPLPLGQAVEVTFTPKKVGPVRYACGMDMIAGVLNVE